MPESTPPMNKIVVQTLIKGLEEAKNSMQNMQKQIHSMEITLTELKSQNDNMSDDVHQMVKIIRDGNGKEPLIDRVTKLENKAEGFSKHIEEGKQAKVEDVKGSWLVKVAILTGSIGMIGGIVNTILTLFVK